MKTRADFEKGPCSTIYCRLPCSGVGDSGEDLQEGRLPSTVVADNADDLSLLDVKRNVVERPDNVLTIVPFAEFRKLPEATEVANRKYSKVRQASNERLRLYLSKAYAIALGQMVYFDGNVVHYLLHHVGKISLHSTEVDCSGDHQYGGRNRTNC